MSVAGRVGCVPVGGDLGCLSAKTVLNQSSGRQACGMWRMRKKKTLCSARPLWPGGLVKAG